MANTTLSDRAQTQQGDGQTFTGTIYSFDKRGAAIIGVMLDLSADADITWHVSQDNSTWYAITPPSGTWTAFGTTVKAIPADHLAFLAPYAYARLTFSVSQTDAVAIIAKMA